MRSKFKVTVVIDASGTKEEVQTALHHGIWNILDNASFITGKKEVLRSIEVTKIADVPDEGADTTRANPEQGGADQTAEGKGISNPEQNGSAEVQSTE